jgi:hypothetical protein
MNASLFERGQPAVRRVFLWGGQVIAKADQFYSIEVSKGIATPLRVPGVQKVCALADAGPHRAWALGRDPEGLALFGYAEGKWDRLEVPAEVRRASPPPLLCADASSVILLSDTKLFRLDPGGWLTVPLGPRPQIGLEGEGLLQSTHLLLDRERLYAGFDHGEWGGGLLSVDVHTGEWWTKVAKDWDSHLPVCDLAVRPDGTVWAVEGTCHGGLRIGVLSRRDPEEGWNVFCNSSKDRETNWNLSPTSLEAVAWDTQGRLLLLSVYLGLVRYEEGRWTHLTPGWPKFAPATSLCITPEDVAVIGLTSAGVLLLDLRSLEAKRVEFRNQ